MQLILGVGNIGYKLIQCLYL